MAADQIGGDRIGLGFFIDSGGLKMASLSGQRLDIIVMTVKVLLWSLLGGI